MRSSVSIALFFLLSGFFLFALLAAIEHSRKAVAIAGVCLVAVVCIIVFLTPVKLPEFLRPGHHPANGSTTTTTVIHSDSDSGTSTSGGGPPAITEGTTTSTRGDTLTTTTGGTTTTTFDLTPITGTGL